MTYTGTLTSEQLSEIHVERDYWMRVGLSTERCDRAKAESAVRRAYSTAGLDEPEIVVWMDSPMGGAFAAAAIQQLLQLGGQLGDQLWGQLGDQLWSQLGDQLGGQLGGQLRCQLWSQLGDQLRGQLGGQLRGQLWSQLRDQLGGQLWDQLGDQLDGQLRDQLGGQLRGQLWSQLRDQIGGQLDGQLDGQLRDQLGGQLRGQIDPWFESYWIALYMRALHIAEMPIPDRLDAVYAAVAETGWWWPMRGAVILTDRPTMIERDHEGRLHSEDGPALAYADGYTLHSWHGVTVQREVIEDPVESWTIERIVGDIDNSEIRRAVIERVGWDRLEDQLGEPVHVAPDPANPPHELRLYDIPDVYEEPVRLVTMTNASPDRDGTVRRYGETCPASISDAVAASAWAWDVPVETYRALQRAT